MNFNENKREKTEVLNLRLSKMPSAKVLLKLEFDTEDQVLSTIGKTLSFPKNVDVFQDSCLT